MLLDLIDRSSINAKFGALAGTILVLFIVSSAVVVKLSIDIGNEIHNIAVHDIKLTQLLTSINEHQKDQEIAFEKALKYSIWLNSTDDKASVKAKSEVARQSFIANSKTIDSEIQQTLELLDEAIMATHTEHQTILTSLLTKTEQYKTDHAQYERDVLASFEIIDKGDWSKAYAQTELIETQQSALESLLKQQVTAIQQLTASALSMVDEKESTIIELIFANIVINVVVIFLMTTLIGSRIKRQVENCLSALKRMCSGDFSQTLTFVGQDEIGRINQSLNQLSTTTNTVLNEVQDKLHSIACGELASPIVTQSSGVFKELQLNLNTTLDRLSLCIAEVGNSTKAAKNGGACQACCRFSSSFLVVS